MVLSVICLAHSSLCVCFHFPDSNSEFHYKSCFLGRSHNNNFYGSMTSLMSTEETWHPVPLTCTGSLSFSGSRVPPAPLVWTHENWLSACASIFICSCSIMRNARTRCTGHMLAIHSLCLYTCAHLWCIKNGLRVIGLAQHCIASLVIQSELSAQE